MRGHELKARLQQLMLRHNVKPIQRDPLPLAAPTLSPQILTGYAATPDVDSDRMSFQRGSLSWPENVAEIPLLVRHDVDRVAGRIIGLDYDADGKLHIKAHVDDSEARRMGAFSVAATVIASEVRDENSPSAFHFVVTKATIDHIGLTAIPSNARALVTSRRDFAPMDDRSSFDGVMAAVVRAQKAIEVLKASPRPAPAREALPEIEAGPAYVIGRLPRAMLSRSKTPFSQLVAQLPVGDHL